MSEKTEDGILETLNETAEHMIEQDDDEGYGWLANNVYEAMRVIRQIQRERDRYRSALEAIVNRMKPGPGAAVCVTISTLEAIANQALESEVEDE